MIAGYATVFGVVASGTVISHGAFYALVAGKMAFPRMLWEHDLGEDIGRWHRFTEDDTGLLAVGELDLATSGGRRASEMIEAGTAKGLSLGRNMGVRRGPIAPGVELISRVFSLPEISLCRTPKNPLARLVGYTAGAGA
jgi:hypothetical protein